MNHRAPANRRLFLPIRLCLLVLTVAVFAGGAVFLSACRTPGQAPDSPSATATETETVTTEMSGVTEPGNSETETEPESGAGEETAHLHAYGDWAILQAPTCTGAGERTHTCTVCGHVETESVPATGHTSVEDAAVPASCTEDGKTAGAHCAVCGDVLTAQETVPALGHLSEKTEAVLPTCTQNGHGTGVRCGRCGLVLAEPPEIPATGHQPETVPGKLPTCTEAGLTDGAICLVCGTVLTAQTELPAAGHHPDGEASCTQEVHCTVCGAHLADKLPHTPTAIPTQEPTCTQDGHTGGTACAVCGEILTQPAVTPATGHTFGPDATCTEPQVCLICGEIISPASGHFPAVEPGKAPTCTEPGISDYIRCAVCGEVLQERTVLPATGHTAVDTPEIAPTCTEPGYRGGTHCATCGTVLTVPTRVMPTGHQLVYDRPVAATCTEDGLTDGFHCDVCGVVTQPQQRIPATGHSPVTDRSVPPTCTAAGRTEGSHCTVCNAVLVPQVEIPAVGHTFGACPETPPTCTRPGYEAGEHCLVCGYERTVRPVIPATGHTPVTDPAVAPTADDYGWTQGSHCAVCGTVLVAQSRLPKTDTVLHPGDPEQFRGVMIVSVYGTGKKNTDAAASHGFVQLYNSTDRDIRLAGAALYYRKDSGGYTELSFPEDAVIPAGGYYLVRAASPKGYNTAGALINVLYADLDWNVFIDNKEVHLVLAPSGWDIYPTEDITALTDAVSVFVSSEKETYASVFAVNSLSKKKVAVRTAYREYSGYHIENLTRMATPELQRISPRTADGRINPVTCSFREVTFSHTAGIYRDTVELILTPPNGYTVYYTLDGSDPRTSATARAFDGSITLTDSSALAWRDTYKSFRTGATAGVDAMVGGYVVKAYAKSDADATAVYTNTYFILPEDSAWNVNIVSISLPASEMFGRDGFYSFYNNLDENGSSPRGMAVMEVFDPRGSRVGHSNVELAVSGYGSSASARRSLRIYYKGANNQEGGMESDLNYDLFGGLAKDRNGQAITSFSRLLLRNSGQDSYLSGFRDAYMQRVAAGLCVDTMASSAALVFINGEFWGVYNFRERYSPEYVSDHTGANKDTVTVIENANNLYNQNPDVAFVDGSGVAGYADEFNWLLEFADTHDLSVPENFAWIESKLDLDSLIDLCAVRVFFNATDWPENNIKLWRDTAPDSADARWHFVLLDTDWGMGMKQTTGPEMNLLFILLNYSNGTYTKDCPLTRLLHALRANRTFDEKLIARFWSLPGYLNADRLNEELDQMVAEREPLMGLQADRWPKDNLSLFSKEIWYEQISVMRDFILRREEQYRKHMRNFFRLSDEQFDALVASYYPAA